MARSKASLGLQQIDVFRGLHVQTLKAIADQCKWTRYRPNEYVIRREGADKDVYFVIAGMVRVTAEGWRGRRITLRDLPAGELFGEHSAIDGQPRIADVLAVQETLVASMSPEAFRALLGRHASIRERVLRRVTSSVRELSAQIVDLGVKRVPGRIWSELLRIARLSRVENNTAIIDKPPSHRDIAHHIGTSREQVAREFSRLYRQGLLARDGKAIVVRNLRGLQEKVAGARAALAPPEQEADHSAMVSIAFQRQRRAVLAAEAFDVVAMVERDEERTLQRWKKYLAEVTSETIPSHGGRSFAKALEHGLVAEFPDAAHAMACAFQLLDIIEKLGAETGSRPMRLRIGVHIADILVEDFNISGDGVNIAMGLAQLANPGEILSSIQVRDQLASGWDGSFEDLGEQRLRNRERAIRAFRVWSQLEPDTLNARPASNLHGRPSVAVIPFRVQSGDARFEFLGDGLADETIRSLSRVADFFVVSRLSSMAFRRSPANRG